MNDVIKKTGKLSSFVGGIGIFLVGLIILAISLFALLNLLELIKKIQCMMSCELMKKIDIPTDNF